MGVGSPLPFGELRQSGDVSLSKQLHPSFEYNQQCCQSFCLQLKSRLSIPSFVKVISDWICSLQIFAAKRVHPLSLLDSLPSNELLYLVVFIKNFDRGQMRL